MNQQHQQHLSIDVTIHMPDLKQLLRQVCETPAAGPGGGLEKLAALIQRNFNLQETNMATTTERLEAISTAMDEVASDIAELVKKSQQQPPPPPEDFEAALVKLESKVTSAKDQYTADPVVDTGPVSTDPT